ncbi:autotransporter domain-containing protein [Rickettsia endosymbiont of Halotydeus destructor]|uniref:autotransporter family protein n=1 Tax=Rickettsia endosymbiont of Halotydeus destructor TaxID=2996754 RepID=UPI003BAFA708
MNNSKKILSKIFKTGLVTASSLTLLMSEGAFAAEEKAVPEARQAKEKGTKGVVSRENTRHIYLGNTQAPLKGTNGLDDEKEFVSGSTLQLNDKQATINTGRPDDNILALDLHGQAAIFNIRGNISLGSVVDNIIGSNKKLKVKIKDGQSLTLTGTSTEALDFTDGTKAALNNYTALGNIELEQKATLIVNSDNSEKITLAGDVKGGQVTVNTDTEFTGTITDSTLIVINEGEAQFKNRTINPKVIQLAQANSILTFTNTVLTSDIENVSGEESKGILNLNGENLITSKIGATNSLKAINIIGDATFESDITTDKINLADNTTLTFYNNTIVAGNIITTKDGQGTLNIGRSRDELNIMTGKIGTINNSLCVIKANSKELMLQEDVYTKKLIFNYPKISLIMIGGNLTGEVDFADKANVLIFDGPNKDNGYKFEGGILNGAKAEIIVNTPRLTATDATIGTIETIKILQANTLAIDANAQNINLLANGNKINFEEENSTLMLTNANLNDDMTITLGQSLEPQANEHGKIIIDSAESGKTLTTKNYSLGTNNKKLKEITFQGNGNFAIESEIFATDIIFNSAIFTSDLNSTGKIITRGTTKFMKGVNNTGDITLSNRSTTKFAGDITAANIAANEATLVFLNNLKVKANLEGSNTNIDLGNSTIKYDGKAAFSDQLTINAQSQGNILIENGGIDLSTVTNLIINFNSNNIRGDEYILIQGEANSITAPTASNITHNSVNDTEKRFVRWSITSNNSSLTLYPAEEAESGKEELSTEEKSVSLLSAEDNNNAEGNNNESKENLFIVSDKEDKNSEYSLNNNKHSEVLSKYNLEDGELKEFRENLDQGTTQEVEKLVAQLRDQNKVLPSKAAAVHIKPSNTLVVNMVETRMSSVVSAVSSGDESTTKAGVWANPFIGNSSQKMKGDMNDYKTKSSGATIGFDAFLTDDLLLGASYTKAYTKVKHKGDKLGDENKINSDIFSLYGLYDCPNSNWFVSGIALYSNSLVKNYSQRFVILGGGMMDSQTAISKHKSYSYIGQILVGYDYMPFESFNLKPMAGVRYSNSRDASYVESGTSFQNLTVKGATSDSFEGILGFRASKNINTGHMILTPELYSFVHRHFKDNSSTIDIRLPGMANPFPSSEITNSKTSFNIGTGVTAKHKMMEYGINYNVNIANKYFAQQGSFKIRVNF